MLDSFLDEILRTRLKGQLELRNSSRIRVLKVSNTVYLMKMLDFESPTNMMSIEKTLDFENELTKFSSADERRAVH